MDKKRKVNKPLKGPLVNKRRFAVPRETFFRFLFVPRSGVMLFEVTICDIVECGRKREEREKESWFPHIVLPWMRRSWGVQGGACLSLGGWYTKTEQKYTAD